jgi:hypothetical protein
MTHTAPPNGPLRTAARRLTSLIFALGALAACGDDRFPGDGSGVEPDALLLDEGGGAGETGVVPGPDIGPPTPPRPDTGLPPVSDSGVPPTPGPDLAPCARNGDCAGGEVCRAGTCRAICSEAEPCVGALNVCDTEGGFCGQCSDTQPCTNGRACETGLCTGGCLSNLACEDGEVCEDGVCTAPLCAAGETTCEGDRVGTCGADGRSFEFTSCNADDSCTDDDGFGCTCREGACAARTCRPGSLRCAGPGAQACRDDGSGWGTITPCEDDEECVAGACLPQACEAGDTRCAGSQLLACGPDGLFSDITECASTGRVCRPTEAGDACLEPFCVPNSRVCTADGGSVLRCDDRGEAQETVACRAAQRCWGGECRARVCDPGAGLTCADGNVANCQSNGTATAATETCASGCRDGACIAVCGNGALEPGEACDPSVPGTTNCAEDCTPLSPCPTARITCALRTTAPPSGTAPLGVWVNCSGTDSSGTSPITSWDWSLLSRPPGASATLRTTGSSAWFAPDGTGDWTVGLTVTDRGGNRSCSQASWVQNVPTRGTLQIDLRWVSTPTPSANTHPDMDLHLLRLNGNCWLDRMNDCHWGNKTPNWGSPDSTLDNPSLVADSISNGEPERILLPVPSASERFMVGARFFGRNGGSTTSIAATVEVRVDDIIIHTGTRTLTNVSEFWTVGEYDPATRTFTPVNRVAPRIEDACPR